MGNPAFRDAEYAGWSSRADTYDMWFSAISNQAIPTVLDAVEKSGSVLAGRRLLDVCCGPGHLAAAAAARGATVEGVDFAESMVARAQRNYPALTFRQGDAEQLPHGDGSLDAVTCVFGVMHLESPDRAIAEAWRVLTPGGTFAFTQWAQDDELLSIVGAAVSEHGSRDVLLPPAPPLMRFADPKECRGTLEERGFSGIAISVIDLVWEADRAEAILDCIHGGAVRASMLIEAQPAFHRARVEAAIVARVQGNRAPGNDRPFQLRRPAILAVGQRPVG